LKKQILHFIQDDSRLDVILIIMKAMDCVTAVAKMTNRGGQPLWNTSHWMFTRTTLGHG
jgi:hypothetical protein